jgi:hypothetical protein
VPTSSLWPPLKQIEAALLSGGFEYSFGSSPTSAQGVLDPQGQAGADAEAANALASQESTTSLVQQEECTWAAGEIVHIVDSGVRASILLDHRIQDQRWLGWVAASETSWASAFDVLLEPQDEPFDPMAGVIQTWNPVEVEWKPSVRHDVLAQLSTERMNSIRAVAKEATSGLLLNIPAQPGVIALRTAASAYMVLTGTPLGARDIRRDYQAAYLSLSARLMALQLTQRASMVSEEPAQMVEPTPARRVDFEARLKPGVRIIDIQPLLRATLSYIVSGPDVSNRYAIKSSNPSIARLMFAQSMLIEGVFED